MERKESRVFRDWWLLTLCSVDSRSLWFYKDPYLNREKFMFEIRDALKKKKPLRFLYKRNDGVVV